jgi:cytochrome c-type biogenesis protein CcmH
MLVFAAEVIDVFEFDSPADEARYRALAAEFRCPKCLNTNLTGSDAPIAADLRREVARLVREGVSDQAIRDHLQARYGDFVLYNPPVRGDTLILWVGPAVLVVIGLLVIVVVVRRRRPEATLLSDAERARLDELLKEQQT